ncbi:DUF6680 family protein [Citrobacter youngae]|uniref:DUF6680 family protein n=1 Tax=Citrobacter youngae TaxID=133448 RepID=UPI0039B5C201
MSTALTIIAITATVISPLLAVQTQKFIEKYSQQKSLKIDIFKQLMATRSQNARLSNEHVRALNMIDLAFYGKVKKGKTKRSASEGRVLSSWKLYFAHLNTSYPGNDNTQGAIWNQTSNNLFLDLLSDIAKDIGYDFERVQLQTATYSPVAHGAIESDQIKIRKGLAAIFSGEDALKMEIINIPARQDN